MWSISVEWIVLAVLVFWAVGAYNRIMRLRTACVQAFGALDSYLQQAQGLLGEWNAAQTVVAEETPADDAAADDAAADAAAAGTAMAPQRLADAAWQQSLAAMGAALAAARARPLHAPTLERFERAHEAQFVAWQALKSLPGTCNDPAWRLRWQQQQAQAGLATDQFNTAVAHYNAAIAQFPARVLAWFFGFRAARPLQPALGAPLSDTAA